jgi:hypothetical protein
MPGVRLSYLRLLLPGPHVAATPVGPIGGGVALEPSHLDLSVAHHYHELAEAGAHFIGLPRLEPSQVEPFSMSVVRQRGYSNSQKKPNVQTLCKDALLPGRFCTFPGRFPAAFVGTATLTPATTHLISRIACGLLAVATIACGKTADAPPKATAGPAEHIAGTERFGWTQTAADNREVSTFRYAAYVDGIRVELMDVSCEPPASPTSTAFECSAPLPAMSSGPHALELAMFVVDGGTVRESPRSAPMKVMKAGADTAPGRR